jgi:NAD(P)H-binding
MARHVVIGNGQIARPLIERLVAGGHDVVGVSRSGTGAIPGATVVAADASDVSTTGAVVAGADCVYFCLNAVRYDRWPREFPPLQRNVLAAAEAVGARLVVLGTTCTRTARPTGRSCASTPTPATSSPTAGSWTTAASAPPSASGATPPDEAVAATVSWYEQRSAAAGVPAHVDGAADTGQVQRHAQQAGGDEHGGGDHGKAEVEQLEEQCESKQDSGDDRSHDAYLSM